MPMNSKLALATVVVVAVGALAGCQLAGPGESAPPAATSSPTTTPTQAPAATARPTELAGAHVPPALTETFISGIHGLSISYPAGWSAKAATEPWTVPDPPHFGTSVMDFLYDPARDDHFFLQLGSQALGDIRIEDWMAEFIANEGCAVARESVVADADSSTLYNCYLAVVSRGGRGYFVWMYTSGDDADLEAFDADGGPAWFEEILATVELHPEDAVVSRGTP